MQVKALNSKHEHNGPEAPDAFISSKLVVVKQPREQAGFLPKYCFHSRRRETREFSSPWEI